MNYATIYLNNITFKSRLAYTFVLFKFRVISKNMNKTGPIIIIEDDVEDKEILTEIFKELKIENEIVFFKESD